MADSSSEVQQARYSKENRWYYKSIDDHINQDSRELLEEYSHIPVGELDSHIHEMRDTLWSYGPYPCIGKFKFLTLNFPSHPRYEYILEKMDYSPISLPTSGTSRPLLFLDLGCCVAQELRSLSHKGIYSEYLYGTDLNPQFLRTSYELFKDKDTFKGKLVAADIYSPTLFSGAFQGWENKFSFIHAGLFLHLFSWEQQVTVCCTVVRLLSMTSGSLFIGEMVGCEDGERHGEKGIKVWKKGEERKQYLHDPTSFKKLWDDVAEQTGTVGKWKVEGGLKVQKKGAGDPTGGRAFFTGEGIGWFTFSVEKVR